ncbi:MAG: DUF1444 family protein, partial [Planctomycetota bacterium]
AVKERLPEAEVEITAVLELRVRVPTSESKFKCWLGNVWAECADKPGRRRQICNRYIEAFAKSVTNGPDATAARDPKLVVPVLKCTDHIDQLPVQNDGSKPIVAEHFAADIWIVYAYALDDQIAFFADDELQLLNMTMAEVRRLAVRNLARILPEVRRYGQGPVYLISAGGNYEPSLLLFEKLWDDQKGLVSGDIVAAVPCASMLMFTGSESTEGIEIIKAAIDEVFEKEPHWISQSLLVRRNNKWQPFEQTQW